MAVYYRYRSGVETFSVPVPAPTVSVADLKRLILGTSRHGHGRTRGRGPRESIALSDAQTGEEYTDDNAMVPRNATVLVRRVAGGPPAETITIARSPLPPKTVQDNDASAGSDGKIPSSGAQDDEARAISAVIDATEMKWEGRRPFHSQGVHCYGGRGAQKQQRTPPAGYVCHRCRVPGHFIQHCPTNGDPRFDFGRASSSSATKLPAPVPASTIPIDDGILPELHCKMCQNVMADAVVTGRCCFDSFCDACIRGHIVGKSKCVCGARASADALVPNQTLRATIANMQATRAATGASSERTDNNQKSSAGSNEEATSTSKSPAASHSQRSRSQVTAMEHNDGSASSSTSKSAATPAVREPRTKQTTAKWAQTMVVAGYPMQFGYGGPFGPACYDPFFGDMTCAPDPYAYYGVSYGGGYPVAPVLAGYQSYQDGGHGRKRKTGSENLRFEVPGFKKRCGSSRLLT